MSNRCEQGRLLTGRDQADTLRKFNLRFAFHSPKLPDLGLLAGLRPTRLLRARFPFCWELRRLLAGGAHEARRCTASVQESTARLTHAGIGTVRMCGRIGCSIVRAERVRRTRIEDQIRPILETFKD